MALRAIVTQDDPFQISINNIPGQPGKYTNLSISVPPGKMLVIMSASVRVHVPSGQEVMAYLSANGPPGLTVGSQYMVLTRQGTFDGVDVFTANHAMLLWAGNAGAHFNIVRSSDTGLMSVEVSAVGFFEAQSAASP